MEYANLVWQWEELNARQRMIYFTFDKRSGSSASQRPQIIFIAASKIQVNFWYRRYSKVLMIVSDRFLKFLHYACFRRQEILCFTELPCSGDLGNPWQLPDQEVIRGTNDCVLWIFTISSVFMLVSKVKDSIADIPTVHTCLGDLENPGKLPVQEILRGTFDHVLRNSTLSSLFRFLKSRKSLLTFTCSCSGDFKNTVQLPVQKVFRGTNDCVLWIFIISSVFMLSRSTIPLLTFIRSFLVCVTSKTSRTRTLF